MKDYIAYDDLDAFTEPPELPAGCWPVTIVILILCVSGGAVFGIILALIAFGAWLVGVFG